MNPAGMAVAAAISGGNPRMRSHWNSFIVGRDPNLSKHPEDGMKLAAADQRALVAFLRTLTDARFEGGAGPPGPPSEFDAPSGRALPHSSPSQ